ncbi:hypothetical protein R3P38DRAFT_3346454 [Favolaschia claudopus]|uniref:Reverse transcriptase zinc-binding domain-containing protein n=1 Tax=Favolaschia claudopus TaxID=2862362 RepID=A0AAW0D387_9AGAR
MITAAKKFHLTFTALSISKEIQLQMPVWNHLAMTDANLERIRKKKNTSCLRQNHRVKTVLDILQIAHRTSTNYRRPHILNPSGVGRKNCGCPPCQRDRNEFHCRNPGECIETAKLILQCIPPKWNPEVENLDHCDTLALTEEEQLANKGVGDDKTLTFDPDYRLTDMSHGFRIFASDDYLQQTAAKRYGSLLTNGDELEAQIHARVSKPGQANSEMTALIHLRQPNQVDQTLALRLSFTEWDLYPSFNTALLGGLLHIISSTPLNTPLKVFTTSDFLGKTFVKNRCDIEKHPLEPNFRLVQTVISRLNERTARTRFTQSKVTDAFLLQHLPPHTILLDAASDLMFSLPGIRLKAGNQRLFTKVIMDIKGKLRPPRKSTTCNLERIRCSLGDEFKFYPSDSAIWRSMRCTDINRLTRNFLWKCVHETFHVGLFWDKVNNFEHFGECSLCRVPETMEHILLDCNSPSVHTIWQLAEFIWSQRYRDWPSLNWGLLLGCSLSKFKSNRGKAIRGKNRFFTIIVSSSMQLIWTLRNERVLERKPTTTTEARNRWLAVINAALTRDRILANKARFGKFSRNKRLVLETWSGVLHNEEALPEDWICAKEVLVGIRPAARNNGVG